MVYIIRIDINKIAIAGGIATGKTTVARIIAKALEIPRLSFGDALRQYCLKQGMETTRATLQELGDRLIYERGHNGFLDFIITESSELVDWSEDLIMEGFRHSEIYRAFYEKFPESRMIYCYCSREEGSVWTYSI